MSLYGVKCDVLATQSNSLVFHIPNQYAYFAFRFLRLTCDICVFQCNADTDVEVQSVVGLLHKPIK